MKAARVGDIRKAIRVLDPRATVSLARDGGVLRLVFDDVPNMELVRKTIKPFGFVIYTKRPEVVGSRWNWRYELYASSLTE